MLQVILDADTRLQLERLVIWLKQAPADPFVPDTLIVPDLGSGIWLQQSIARSAGISANLRLELPGAYIWRNVQQAVGGQSGQAPFDPLVARWAIVQALSEASESVGAEPAIEPVLRAWIDASERDRMFMATELARQFDRYLAYRRHWLEAWSAGRYPASALAASRAAGVASVASACAVQHEPWQAWLWGRLLGQISGFSDRHPFDTFVATGGELKQPAELVQPGRVAVFGQISLPAEQTRMLALLARSRPIIWFGYDPSQGFWEHVVSERRAQGASQANDAQTGVTEPDLAWLYENEPVVLGEWGQQCRDSLMQLRVLEEQGLALINDEHLREREPAAPLNNLDRLQHAVLTLSDDVWRDNGCEPDASLQIHSAHSLMRQADVACDLVLDAFATLPDLTPADVVIFCVDVDETAPLLRTALQHPSIDLPLFAAGGRTGANPLLRALQGFIRLVEGPANVSSVFDWLEGPAQQVGSSIDSEVLQSLRRLVNENGLHRDDLGGSGSDDVANPHGWFEGIDRLVLGGILGQGSEPFVMSMAGTGEATRLPASQLSVAQIDALGEVARLLDLVRSWRGGDEDHRTAANWSTMVQQLVDQLLSGPKVSENALLIRDSLIQLTESVSRVPNGDQLTVSFTAYAQALDDHLRQGQSPARATGSITVAPVGALREVPFRVCIMIGLDEGHFPPRRRTSEYDLMSLLPETGDVNPGAAGRGWFLQALLNTQDRVCLCYQGRHVRSDAPMNPSRLISELLEYLARFDADAATRLVTQHPLQSFSPRRFAPDAPIPSFARHWYDAAAALSGTPGSPPTALASLRPASPDGLLRPSGERSGSDERVAESKSIWQTHEIAADLLNPARAFLRHTGGMSLLPFEASLEDLEPLGLHDFSPQTLFDLAVASASQFEQAWSPDRVLARLKLSATLPAGQAIAPIVRAVMATAERVWRNEQAKLIEALVDSDSVPFEQKLSIRLAVREVADAGAPTNLVSGQSGALYANTNSDLIQRLPAVRTQSLRHLLTAWLAHLLVCGEQPEDRAVTTFYLVAGDQALGQLRPVVFDRQSLRIHNELSLDTCSPLSRLVMAAQAVGQQVTPLFPRTTAAWLDHAEPGEPFDSPQDNVKAFEAARKVFEGADNTFTTAECHYAWPAALWRGQPPSVLQALEHSLPLYAPIWWASRRTIQADSEPNANAGAKPERATDD